MAVLVVDLFSLFFRAYHALPPMTTSRGEPTSALYGLSALLLKLFREDRPEGAVFAIDLPVATFRHRAYGAYKGTRVGAPAGTLAQQLGRLRELLAAFDLPVYGVPGFEADDVLATLARELVHAGQAPMVVTGDRDALQLARGPARVLLVSRLTVPDRRWDEAAVHEAVGVWPQVYPDYVALVGDPSDNLPGVPGVGKRTAVRLITRFGSVPSLLARVDEVQPVRVREALRGYAGSIVRSLDLARLHADVPLPPGPRWAPFTPERRERVRALFERLEFRSLLPRLEGAPTAP